MIWILVAVHLQGSNLGNDVFQGEGEPFIEGDGTITVVIHLLEHLCPLIIGGKRYSQAASFLSRGSHIDHLVELITRDHSISVSISSLEALPVEPVQSFVLSRSSLRSLLAHTNKGILFLLVKRLGETTSNTLVVLQSMIQPLIEGNATIIVGVNLLEECLTVSLSGGLIRALLLAPPLVSKLSRKGGSSFNHAIKLLNRDYAIKVNISSHKGSEENVVELNVAVIRCVGQGTDHEEVKVRLASNIHSVV